jgi:nitrile hydratase accessory protein
LSQADGFARFAATGGLPRDADGPVFDEPWQAEAFALTIRLHEAGRFTWNEWAETLAAVLRETRERGEADDGSRYYDHWLVALERMVTSKHLLNSDDLHRRKSDWAKAYRSTPHGEPVVLPPGNV